MEYVTFEVVADDIVDVIGKGVALPKKTYPGRVEWRTVALSGQLNPYLAVAQLLFSAAEQEAIGLPNPRDVWCPVSGHVKIRKDKNNRLIRLPHLKEPTTRIPGIDLNRGVPEPASDEYGYAHSSELGHDESQHA